MNIKPFHLIAVVLGVAVLSSGADGVARSQSPEKGVAAAAAISSVPTSKLAKPARDEQYVIGGDDVLAVNVWNEPEFKQSIPVRSDGKISLPLIGEVTAAGRTPGQVQNEIAAQLATYFTNPNVTVIVTETNSHKFNILGRVVKPGSYHLGSTTTVLDTIAQAGGFQDFAKSKDIYVLRTKPGVGEVRLPFNYKDVIKGKHPEQNITLQPHDTVIVP